MWHFIEFFKLFIMKLRLVSYFLFLFIQISAFANATPINTNDTPPSIAAGALSGTVTDKADGKPIIGATVSIPDLKVATQTDVNGKYAFSRVPKGIYLVQISYLGYSSFYQRVDFSKTTQLDVTLKASAIEAGEVVITGVSRATEIKRNPVPMLAVSKAYLQRQAGTNIIDEIAKLPGINQVTTGPNVSKPYIRGLGYNRIVTLADGIRQEGQQWGDEHGIEVDQNAIDRVEVIKGPASLIYGSDAIGGVVNLLPPPPAAEGTVSGSVLANYQSNNGLYATSARIQGNNKGFVWSGIFSAKEAKNYQNKIDGRVYGTGFKEYDGRVMAGVNKSWGYSYFNASAFSALQEIPDGSRDSVTRQFTKQITEDDAFRPVVSNKDLNSYTITPLHQKVENYKIYNNTSVAIGGGTLLASLGYQYSHRREFSHPEAASTPGLNLQLGTLTYDFKYNFDLGKDYQTTIGVNGMYQHNSIDNSTDFLIPNFNVFDVGPFALVKKEFNKLTVSAGARFDSRSFNSKELYTATNPTTGFDEPVAPNTAGANQPFSNYKNTFSGVSGSIGASYVFSDRFTMKANIGRGFRAPNISELSDNGVHPGTNVYQIGNASFKPEFNLQEDLGLFFSSKYVVASAEVFNNNIQNYIYNQKLLGANGQDSVIVQGNQTFKFQQTSARLYGGEASIDIHPISWLHFYNALTLTYGSNRGNNNNVADSLKYLPFIPPTHTYSELKAEFAQQHGPLKDIYFKVGLDHYSKQDRYFSAYGTETMTAGYNLLSAGIGSNVVNSAGKQLFSIFIEGSNLTNVAYQSHLSRLKYFTSYNWPGLYNMGRNISFKIIVPFGSETKKSI
jgi:iron complex outermembrane receptor protein